MKTPPTDASALHAAQAALHDVERFIERGTPEFFWANLALFAAGFATFALLYCVQPIMPLFSREFGVSPAQASLSMSVTTQALAAAMLVAGALSEVYGRKPVMAVSIVTAALLLTASAFAPTWHAFLLLRLLSGLAFSGLPATAMAYVGEEMHPEVSGMAMGLYISGTGLGALGGRLIVSVMADLVGWRSGLFTLGLLSLASGIVFWVRLPRSRHFEPHPLRVRPLLDSALTHLKDPVLLGLFAEGFLLLGALMAFYNYLGYRLMAPPYGFSQTAVGLLFLISLTGILSSAFTGDFANRMGRPKVFCSLVALMLGGALATLSTHLALIIAGAAVLSFAFYGAHSVASAWVSARAQRAKAQAASLYLFAYYTGSSVVGWSGGLGWSAHGWPGVMAIIGGCLGVALILAWWLNAQVAPARQNS